MKKKQTNLLFLGFLAIFFIIGYVSFKEALPEAKNERVYALIKPYLPYQVERRLGGFTVIDKLTGEKEKPPASEALKFMDSLDKQWGKEYLQIKQNQLYILNKEKKVLKTISLSASEKEWVKRFFEI
ncbi:hypothetical protein [Candidatus Marinarcus aquaticus]|uniref:Uncharacterized protein n=1 Tax=Candidatus Marinarcus aquaticus TaxID=2044504 RepID=A0A4Q0XRC1_9BACT|nr:hypothetical protein [Candidatus Marinarcus aquaticus]RXJ57607.1 hypothetical protein CRV04_07285 [Candidatus Marinarcus aquaticus]